MSQMILHCNAHQAGYDELKKVVLPENHEKFKGKCDRYGTIPHHRIVDAVRTMSAHLFGKDCIERETFGLSGGNVYPGARFFGLFRINTGLGEAEKVAEVVNAQDSEDESDEAQIQRIADLENVGVPDEQGGEAPVVVNEHPEDWNVMADDRIFPAFAIRNSYDRSMAVSAALGYDCFICDNLALSGEVMFSRKHTKNAFEDVLLTFWTLVQTMEAQHQFDLEYRDAAKNMMVSDDRGFELLGRMAGEGLLAFEGGNKSQFALALREWKKPQHEIFEPRNLWSLHNAVTFAQRKAGIAKRLEAGSTATSVFRGLLGEQWIGKAEEITANYRNPTKATILDLLDVIADMKDYGAEEVQEAAMQAAEANANVG